MIIADRRAHTDEIRRKVLERDQSLPGPELIGQVTHARRLSARRRRHAEKKLAVLGELDEIIDSPTAQLADDDDKET